MAQLGRWIILEAAWPASSLVPLCQTKLYQLIFDLINLVVILYIDMIWGNIYGQFKLCCRSHDKEAIKDKTCKPFFENFSHPDHYIAMTILGIIHNSCKKNNKHQHKIFRLIGRDWYWVLITKMHHPQCFVGCIEGKVGCWCSKAINSQLFGLVASKHFPGVQILTKSHSRPMCCHRIFSHKTFGTGTSAKAHTDFHDSGFLFS